MMITKLREESITKYGALKTLVGLKNSSKMSQIGRLRDLQKDSTLLASKTSNLLVLEQEKFFSIMVQSFWKSTNRKCMKPYNYGKPIHRKSKLKKKHRKA